MYDVFQKPSQQQTPPLFTDVLCVLFAVEIKPFFLSL